MLIALLWGAALQQDQRTHEIHEAGIQLELANYARLLEAHTRSVVRGLDQVVTHLKAEYEDDPEKFDLKAQVALSPILKGLSVQVGIIGADGFLAASTSPFTPPVDLSDREHYKVHSEDDAQGLFISKPVLGRASGKWSIQLARRLNAKDGGFAGVMVVSLSPDYISDIYEKIELGPKSAIVVLGKDGVVRARASDGDRTVGQSYAQAPFFADMMGQPEGFIVGSSPVDGVARLRAFRALADYPLVVMVGRPASILSEALRGDHVVLFGGATFGSLMVLLGSLVIQRQLLREQAISARLRSRETELEYRNRDLERFHEVLAHHLQEPVRLQAGYAQRLERMLGGSLPSEARDALERIQAGALRQRALVRDVESFLSLDRLPVEAGGCDLERTLGEVLSGLQARLDGAEIVVRCAGAPRLALDRRRCTELLDALVGNALIYRRPGVPPRIVVEAGPAGGDLVGLAVIDNGIGIAPEYRQRVFDVFERLHANDEYSGTGIGLSLARKVVEMAGGRIWIEDGVDGGVAVRVELPAHKD